MQEFCPQCAKNGQENKIRAFQLNHTEAVLMCSSEECIWPVGHQKLTFINRLVGKEHSSNWEKLVRAHIKTEHDRLLEFQPYTPPQTPSTFPDIMSIPIEDIIFLPDDQQFPNSFIKPCSTIADSTASSKVKPKPKVISIETVTNMPTSLADKPKIIKHGKYTLGPPQIRQVKIEPKETIKVLTCPRKIGQSYKKFSLTDLSNTEDKVINKVPKSNVIKVEGAEIIVKDCLDELSTITNKVESSNVVSTIGDTSNPKDLDAETIDDDVLDIDLDEFFEGFSNEIEGTIKSEIDNSNEFNFGYEYDSLFD
ncbi:hypothetical protein TSAR_011913 [Trichomalopsis sarcophagae]|uniref:Uncharacterized protein n=1 Tax=Trichomalopsis sarcophagae TaxID=543379 RepID=A0A232F2X9_9HYME|nr:hypothetical protein TSAR_011913 [Trichomalopsis sarcophagae]